MFKQFFRNRFGQKRDDNGSKTGGRRGQGRGASQGQSGSGNKPGSGPGGNCVCPKCGHKEPHLAGQRCIDQICPKCGTKMMRE